MTSTSKSGDIATKPYNRTEAFARKTYYRALRAASLQRTITPRGSYLHFVPAVTSPRELADLSARVNWYLPNRRVDVFVEGSAIPFTPEDADYMDPDLVQDPGWSSARPAGSPEYVFWRAGPSKAPRFVSRARRSEIVDWDLYWVSDHGWLRLFQRYCAPLVDHSGNALREFIAAHGGADSALTLGTGPSASLVDPSNVDADVRIVCNSAVRDDALIAALKPAAIAFSDPVFHLSPNRYAAAFRADLVRAAEASGAFLLTTDHWSPFFLARHPELASRTIVLRPDASKSWRPPSPDDLSVAQTGNVLTVLQLPVAWALAKRVEIAGCDGRKPSEKYFWKHNQKIQYSPRLMDDASRAHPAFFRDVDYGEYYDRHCTELEELLAAVESSGKVIESVTPSWIPALRSRQHSGMADPEN